MTGKTWQIGRVIVSLLLAGMSGTGLQAAEAYEESAFGLESGLLWQVGSNTPLDYQLVPNQLVWRSGEMLGWSLADGSHISVRNRLAGLATWVAKA